MKIGRVKTSKNMGYRSSKFFGVGLALKDQERGYGCAIKNEFQAQQHSQEPDGELTSLQMPR
jgi:hypothetical protein